MSHDPDDLDRLVSQLDERAAPPVPVRHATTPLETWLAEVRARNGSDLLLVCRAQPAVRANGTFLPVPSSGVLDAADIESAVFPMMTAALTARFRAGEAVDLAFTLPGLGRFRMNVHRERGQPAAAIRALPRKIPRLSELGFPHDIRFLTALPRGLLLIGGPTGSGKTTTLAALIAELNLTQSRHIVTVEDPIEYEHAHDRCVIEQVEIGVDAPDFPTALRAAVRQAPDVIVIGELRDPETMRIALSAAETGHLVLATIHTTDVAASVSRIVDGFPTERQNAVRQEMAMALSAVLTQTLLPTTSGTLAPVAELLMVSYGARQHIRTNALQHLHQEITITRKSGSFSLEESLALSVRNGVIDRKVALLKAAHMEELTSLLGV